MSGVTVEGTGLNVATSDGSVKHGGSREFIDEIPLNGRTLQNLLPIIPGIGYDTSNQGYTVNGTRVQEGTYFISGVVDDGAAAALGAAGWLGILGNMIIAAVTDPVAPPPAPPCVSLCTPDVTSTLSFPAVSPTLPTTNTYSDEGLTQEQTGSFTNDPGACTAGDGDCDYCGGLSLDQRPEYPRCFGAVTIGICNIAAVESEDKLNLKSCF